MKKCFVILMFGEPFPWIDQFIDSVQHLEKYGWYWKIVTPANMKSKGNVGIIPMTVERFNELVEEKTGVIPHIMITKTGIPTVHVTDFMVGYGKIFEDYLKEYEFWGMMGGPDIVFGRLDRFLPDEFLKDCDVFTDDPKAINGCFTLFRNTEEINTLFKKIPYWKEAFTAKACKGCLFSDGTARFEHSLYGTDEYGMTEVMNLSKLRYKRPTYYPLHSHDRMENHIPKIKLEVKEDGSLWELLADSNPPEWVHSQPFFGRTILFFHFSRSKKWPL